MDTQPTTESLEILKESPDNPRIITAHDVGALEASIREFGDLSNVIRNIGTDRLVGGHQRTNVFRGDAGARVHITQRYDPAQTDGTTARGYIVLSNGTQFSYREVDWDEEREAAGNIAANEIHGRFDQDKLAAITASLSEGAQKLTGQTSDKVQELLRRAGVGTEKKGRPKIEKWSADALRPLARQFFVENEDELATAMKFLDYVAESAPPS